ncbi:hypothetical protein H0H81_010904 [Sphagnurus paluster]|uniref:NAD(P)-binding protein n=1 Tax=Sphagnurus paluster TaxID=117069 RepID=A0A9P7FUV7_9AGAR|nr:hypothetical protein H0H81_010904 [Sphagnurus paluster]
MSSAVSSIGVALVTGAARGIGRAIALRLAKDGYDVGLNDLPTAEELLDTLKNDIIALGRRPCIVVGDVSVAADVENMVSTVVESLGQLNVMVANAGIANISPLIESESVFIPRSPYIAYEPHTVKVSDWEKEFSVHALGTFLSYKYAALQMIKQGKGGRIIGASSIGGKKGKLYHTYHICLQGLIEHQFSGIALMAGYSASKFAVRGLTQVAGNYKCLCGDGHT